MPVAPRSADGVGQRVNTESNIESRIVRCILYWNRRKYFARNRSQTTGQFRARLVRGKRHIEAVICLHTVLVRRPLPLALTDKQRRLLESWSRGGSTPYRLVVRARILLLAAQGNSNHEIARRLRTNPITVARWRSRFALLGLEGVRREAPRTGSPPPVPDAVIRRIISKTLYERPPGRTHWSTRSLAVATGVSHSTVRRIWRTYGLRPYRSRVALLAHDPRFRPKAVDLVGIYLNPPHRAAALWFGDESKSSRSDSDRGHAAPPKPTAPTVHPWTADLVTTLALLDRRNPLRTSRRYSNQEFLSFLRSVHEGRSGKEKIVLLGSESGPTLSSSLVQWLHRHPEVSTEVVAGTEEWKRKVVDSMCEFPSGAPRPAPPAGLTGFLSAVREWSRESDTPPRPFAWTWGPTPGSRRGSPRGSFRLEYS